MSTILLILFLVHSTISQHGDGPDGILSNWTIIGKNMSRPQWYNDALSSANVQSEDGAISIVLPDGAIWAYGDVILEGGQPWLSNAALRIWTKTLSNGTVVVENAKFSCISNGTARQIIPYLPPENFTSYFIWPQSGDYNSKYMNISYLNCEIGLRDSSQNMRRFQKRGRNKLPQIGTNSSFVAMPIDFNDCCEQNYTDIYNMTWTRTYPAWNNGAINPISPDFVLMDIDDVTYLYQYYLREEFLSFDILLGRINITEYKSNNYSIEYPVFNQSNYEQVLEWKKCSSCNIWTTLPSILQGRNNNVGAQITVTYNELLKQYVMLGFDGDFGAMITLRSSKYPWGEWSKAYNVLNVTDNNDSNNFGYCPYIHPEFATSDTLIFTWAMSDTGFYGKSYFGQLRLQPK